jgi:hypothetical protein
VDIRIIQLRLAHSDIKTTQRYLNITDEELRKTLTGVWERRRQLKAVGEQIRPTTVSLERLSVICQSTSIFGARLRTAAFRYKNTVTDGCPVRSLIESKRRDKHLVPRRLI